MYEFRVFTKKIIKLAPLILIMAVALSFTVSPLCKSVSVVMYLIATEIVVLRVLVELIIRHRKNQGIFYDVLPRSQRLRENIIQSFAKKHAIALSKEYIEKIVRASYSSSGWEKELLIMMNGDFFNIDEWFVCGDNLWLHLYLKVSPRIIVVSDFGLQKKSVDEAFAEMARESFKLKADIRDCVKQINKDFLTDFDEVSFNLWVKYVEESMGINIELPESIIVKNTSEVDVLTEKWTENNDQNNENETIEYPMGDGLIHWKV